MSEKAPTWKKLSAISQTSANPGTMSVHLERSYHKQDDDETEVDMEDVAKGRYVGVAKGRCVGVAKGRCVGVARGRCVGGVVKIGLWVWLRIGVWKWLRVRRWVWSRVACGCG